MRKIVRIMSVLIILGQAGLVEAFSATQPVAKETKSMPKEEAKDVESDRAVDSVKERLFLEKITLVTKTFEKLQEQANKILEQPTAKLSPLEELGGYLNVIDETIAEVEQLVIDEVGLLETPAYQNIQSIKKATADLVEQIKEDQENKKTQEEKALKEKQDQIKKDTANKENITKSTRGTVYVSTANEFRNAFQNDQVSKIILNNDINDSGTIERSKSIEIDGQGFSLITGSMDFEKTGGPVQIADYHDIKLGSSAGLSASVIDVSGSAEGQWILRFGNMTAKHGETGRVERLARADRTMIEIYDKVEISSRAENFYLGAMTVLPGADYLGEVTVYNFSVLWYRSSSREQDTAREEVFRVSKGATANLIHHQSGADGYPAVYQHFQKIEIEEEATYIANMPGNAIRLQRNGATFTVKNGGLVNATSRVRRMPTVAFADSNQLFKAEPGSQLYLIGSGSSQLINMSTDASGALNWARSNNQIILDDVASYDLRNKSKSKVLRIGGRTNSFQILKGDIDLWLNKSNILGPSDESYDKVSEFKLTGTVVQTSRPELSRFKEGNYSRISGMNQQPTVEWLPVTDADKNYRVRVKIGEVPDNEIGADGQMVWLPVYAAEGQASATITNTFGQEKIEKTGKADPDGSFGYARFTDAEFNIAGKKMTAKAARGTWATASESITTVLDVTPPEPAIVDRQDKISPLTSRLTGQGEPGADLTITINKVPMPKFKTQVNEEGKWQLTLPPGTLKKEDQIQFFLQDHAGKRTEIPNPPITNNETGNINPVNDLTYRDRLFKKGTIVNVVGTLDIDEVPQAFDFGTHKIGKEQLEYWPDVSGDLKVIDTRGNAKTSWQLTLQEKQGLANDVFSIDDVIYYHNKSEALPITKEEQVVYSGELKEDGMLDISKDWQKGKSGLFLQIPVEKQRKGSFEGSVSWALRDVPK